MSKFIEIISEMNKIKPADVSYQISDEWKNYANELGAYFGISGEELIKSVYHATGVVEPMLKRIGSIINILYQERNDDPVINIVDTPGQEQFELLKSMLDLNIYSVTFNKINKSISEKAMRDLFLVVSGMLKPGYDQTRTHKYLINFTFLDNVINDIDNYDDTIELIRDEYNNFRKYVDDLFKKISEGYYYNKAVELLNHFSIKELIENNPNKNKLSELMINNKRIIDYNDWGELLNNIKLSTNNGLYKDGYNLLKRLFAIPSIKNKSVNKLEASDELNELLEELWFTSHNKSIDFVNIGRLIKLTKEFQEGLINKPKLIGVNVSSARPVTGFYGVKLYNLMIDVLKNDYNTNIPFIASSFIGEGSQGKTQNCLIELFLDGKSDSWFNNGALSTTTSNVLLKDIKKLFFNSNGYLILEPIIQAATTLSKNELNIDEDNDFYFPTKSELIKRKELWNNYVNNALNNIEDASGLINYFGISSKQIKRLSKLDKEKKDKEIDSLIEVFSIPENLEKKFLELMNKII